MGRTYTILTADTAVVGTFDDITTTSLFITSFLTYDANNVYATATRNSTLFASVAEGFNQTQLATALDTLPLTSAALAAATTQTSGANARAFFEAMDGSLHANIKGALGESDMAFSSYLDQTISGDTTVKDGYFATYYGNWTDQQHFTGNSKGVLFGRRADLSPSETLSFAGGFERSSYDEAAGHKGEVDHYRLATFYTKAEGDFAFAAQALYGYHTISTDRAIAIPNYTDRLKTDYDAHSLLGAVKASYTQPFGPEAELEPYAGLSYGFASVGGFAETGTAPLSAEADDTSHGWTSLGMTFRQYLQLTQLIPASLNATLGWQHRLTDARVQAAYRIDGSAPFTSRGDPQAKDSIVFDAGLAAQLSRDITLDLTYGTRQSADASTHNFRAGVKWGF